MSDHKYPNCEPMLVKIRCKARHIYQDRQMRRAFSAGDGGA